METKFFNENDIRPLEFEKDKLKAIDIDREYLLNRKDEFVNYFCPACESTNGVFYFAKTGIDYCQCPQCKTVFVNPRPSQKVLHDFYSQSKVYDYWNKFIFPASEETRREKIFRPRAEKVIGFCKKYKVDTNIFLEVGAGFGTFCQEVKHANVFTRVIALEPSPGLAESCRKRNLEVMETPIEALQLPENTVDVISSFEVLEHLFSPKAFLLDCKKYLKKGGLIVLTCPNFMGFDIMNLRELSDSVDHEHLNYFNPASLSLLLEKAGFKVLEVETPGKLDVDIVRNKVLTGVLDISVNPFLKHILIDKWEELGEKFQNFLSENKLSSHLWVVAQKC